MTDSNKPSLPSCFNKPAIETQCTVPALCRQEAVISLSVERTDEVQFSTHLGELDVDKLQVKFGKVVRERRLKKGLGQEALADKAGLHRTHVSLLERGKRMPSLAVIKKLAKALDTSMASLVGELD